MSDSGDTSEPDMLYVGRTSMGRNAIMCTGTKSWTAMGLCTTLPIVLFIATLMYLYNSSTTLYIVSLVLYGMCGVVFVLMLALCIISWKVGYDYNKRTNSQHTHQGRRGGHSHQHQQRTYRNSRTLRAHRIHVVAPQPPPPYGQPGQQPPSYASSVRPAPAASTYTGSPGPPPPAPPPPPDHYTMFQAPLSPPPPYTPTPHNSYSNPA